MRLWRVTLNSWLVDVIIMSENVCVWSAHCMFFNIVFVVKACLLLHKFGLVQLVNNDQ